MKYCSLALAVALTVAPVASFSAGPLSLRRDTTTALWASTLEERQTSDAAAAAAAPVRVAPGAGWEPEWENRPGKTNFLDSDPTQPDLSEMWECPLTRWDSNGYVDGRRSTVGVAGLSKRCLLTERVLTERFSFFLRNLCCFC